MINDAKENSSDAAKVNDKEKLASLEEAVRRGDASKLKALLSAGAKAEGRGRSGWTLATMAAAEGSSEILEILIDAGASTEETNAEERTPLMMAAWNGRRAACETLLRKGALLSKDGEKFSAWKMAELGGHEELADFLRGMERAKKEEDVLGETALRQKKCRKNRI